MNLESFDIHPARGFLPRADPLCSLPAEYAAWEETARELPKLLSAGVARDALGRMPALDTDGLTTNAQLRRAMLLLSYFGHAYVWGAEPPARSLPPNLAQPWCRIAAALGRPPVLSYASYALDNWRRLDPQRPIELGNIVLLQNFLGGMDEEWFILVHVDIEAKAANAIAALVDAQAAAAAADPGALTASLARLSAAIARMQATLNRMPERCDPYVYFMRVRPYIHGWKDHPALPDGLLYEGVDGFRGEPQEFRGETGAQSSIVPALDAGLGVTHQNDALASYLREMRLYMPPQHRDFVDDLARRSQVRDAVRDSNSAELRAIYNACLRALGDFRSLHVDFAHRYIQQQAERTSANPSELGTGGTPFMPYLKKHRDETMTHLLPD